jgi:hypothetical protein
MEVGRKGSCASKYDELESISEMKDTAILKVAVLYSRG